MTQQTVIGSLHVIDGTTVVRMDDRFATDADDLWSALTEPDRLARWIATVHGDLRPGGEFQARFTSSWEGPGRVDVCEPPHRLLLTMSPGADDQTVIEAVLTADGDHTRLVVEERGIPLAELADHGAGWQAHIEDLAAHLADRPAADWHTRWSELAPTYRDRAARLA
ncbi:MAG: SRPBCC family protein [Mycobacteriales bacterium]